MGMSPWGRRKPPTDHVYFAITDTAVYKVRAKSVQDIAAAFRKDNYKYYTSMLEHEFKAWDMPLWEKVRKQTQLKLKPGLSIRALIEAAAETVAQLKQKPRKNVRNTLKKSASKPSASSSTKRPLQGFLRSSGKPRQLKLSSISSAPSKKKTKV